MSGAGGGSGGGGGGTAVAGNDVAQELAEVKEEIKELKKAIEEQQKDLKVERNDAMRLQIATALAADKQRLVELQKEKNRLAERQEREQQQQQEREQQQQQQQRQPQQPQAGTRQWAHVFGALQGWGGAFDARRGIFEVAVEFGARGRGGDSIKRVDARPSTSVGRDQSPPCANDIAVDLWFDAEKAAAAFEAKLMRTAGPLPEPALQIVIDQLPEDVGTLRMTHYQRQDDSPQQYPPAGSGSMSGATTSKKLCAQLKDQRLDYGHESLFKNMHIIPASLVDPNRQVGARWLFVGGTSSFHDLFDGGDGGVPAISLRIVGEEPSEVEGIAKIRVFVDTQHLSYVKNIIKPPHALDADPPLRGYTTIVSVPAPQADLFVMAVTWRARCVDKARQAQANGEVVTANDAGGNGWWRYEALPNELVSAISKVLAVKKGRRKSKNSEVKSRRAGKSGGPS